MILRLLAVAAYAFHEITRPRETVEVPPDVAERLRATPGAALRIRYEVIDGQETERPMYVVVDEVGGEQ